MEEWGDVSTAADKGVGFGGTVFAPYGWFEEWPYRSDEGSVLVDQTFARVRMYASIRHIREVIYEVNIPYISSFVWHADPSETMIHDHML